MFSSSSNSILQVSGSYLHCKKIAVNFTVSYCKYYSKNTVQIKKICYSVVFNNVLKMLEEMLVGRNNIFIT